MKSVYFWVLIFIAKVESSIWGEGFEQPVLGDPVGSAFAAIFGEGTTSLFAKAHSH